MTENEKQQITEMLIYMLGISDQRVVGQIIESNVPSPFGIWIKLNNLAFFLGSTIEAARFTAEIGDCWLEPRDGELSEADINWFQRRAELGPVWKRQESPVLEQQRRIRVMENLEWVDGFIGEDFIFDEPFEEEEERLVPRVLTEEARVITLQVEFVRVRDWDGYWILSDDLDTLRQARLRVTDERYIIQMGETRDAEPGMVLTKVMELDRTPDEDIVELRIYSGNERLPAQVLQPDENNQLVVKHLELE